ncbi:MAG: hypothetical protein JRJ00_00245 [Deltaproteobacteria bacterium]|nr:hypothetical protein [Deltaproteobacteria bacterium]
MITDYYFTIGVYREVEYVNSWGETVKQGNWQLDHEIEGFLQARSGGYTQANQANSPLSSHVLYCDPGVDVLEKDRILVDGLAYRLDFVQPARGISGVLHHQEIPSEYLNDIELP